jgi:rSAM/selenodomain-associated transferase 1
MADPPPTAGRLVIMAKEPRLGAVKTRLGREIGSASATRFYRSVTANLIRRLARDPRWQTVVAVAPDAALASPAWPADIRRVPQGRGDLGARMGRLLASTCGRPCVLIGSDIPGVSAKHIADAFALLRRSQLAFGPAEDGGFWLIGAGARIRLAGMLDGVRWSSPQALADTLKNLSAFSVGYAATLSDVDDAASYRREAHAGMRVTLPLSLAARSD